MYEYQLRNAIGLVFCLLEFNLHDEPIVGIASGMGYFHVWKRIDMWFHDGSELANRELLKTINTLCAHWRGK